MGVIDLDSRLTKLEKSGIPDARVDGIIDQIDDEIVPAINSIGVWEPVVNITKTEHISEILRIDCKINYTLKLCILQGTLVSTSQTANNNIFLENIPAPAIENRFTAENNNHETPMRLRVLPDGTLGNSFSKDLPSSGDVIEFYVLYNI